VQGIIVKPESRPTSEDNFLLRRKTLMITKDMTVGEVLRAYPETVQVFLNLGMHCLGCPSSTMESVEGAALTHGRNVDELVAELNKVIEAKKSQ